MRTIVLSLVLFAACTKPNPNVCCTDETDCNAKGIPVGSQCGDGLLCRGNQCIAQPCGSSAECDSSAPYCVAESCSESCDDDAQCPGSGHADLPFCEAGACRQCRSGMNEDCSAATPVCDEGTCRGCTSHEECSTGVCRSDGACATADEIAYVDAAGSETSDCLETAPCTLSRSIAITPAKPYVLIGAGSHLLPDGLELDGAPRSLIGRGLVRPRITRTSQGPIFSILPASEITFEHLEISGATGAIGSSPSGNGIECPNAPVGSRIIHLVDVVLANNAASNLYSRGCTLTAVRCEFRNSGYGVMTQDSTATIDRCSVHDNQNIGMDFDGGLYTLTNSFIYRNGGGGINFYASTTGSRFEFNTIVDNTGGFAALACNLGSVPSTLPNNIIARNSPANTYGNTCTYPSSLIVDSDIAQLHFKSPDVAPYDYRITADSIAIDAATLSTVDHDFDGEARPNGNGRDVGADEFAP